MCVFVCLYSACNCVCMCMSANASRYHYLPSTSLALNVRAITCVCDSPLSQVLSLCSHMQPAHQESTVCRYSHTHMYACACVCVCGQTVSLSSPCLLYLFIYLSSLYPSPFLASLHFFYPCDSLSVFGFPFFSPFLAPSLF